MSAAPVEASTVFDPVDPPRVSHKAASRQARKDRKAQRHAGPRPLEAKTPRQADYIETLQDGDSTFAIGPAGTGKTYVAGRIAAQKLLKGEVDRIIVARVTVSKPKHALGFLPGKLEAKIEPWLVPVIDGIRAEVTAQVLDQWRNEKKFEIASFEHMRGRTFRDAFVILDEAQNADFGDLKLFLTRIGEDTQVVVTGDLDQIDIPNSGLEEVLDLAEEHDVPMHVIEFDDEDVVRSKFARAWVKAFRKREDRAPAGRVVSGSAVNLDDRPDFLNNGRQSPS